MINGTERADRILNALLEKAPRFHGREEAGSKSYAIQPPVLRWILGNCQDGAHSFETGCGYTSVLFAILSSKHTVVSPFPEEHELIRNWCAEHGVGTDHVTFIPEMSQEVLPNLKIDDLDFALIDGDHAFPAPFIDWYYTADRLKLGGYLAVDDTQIPTGRILRDFLRAESERWDSICEIGKTAIYRRSTTSPVARGIRWGQQPYCRVSGNKLLKRIVRKVKRFSGRG